MEIEFDGLGRFDLHLALLSPVAGTQVNLVLAASQCGANHSLVVRHQPMFQASPCTAAFAFIVCKLKMPLGADLHKCVRYGRVLRSSCDSRGYRSCLIQRELNLWL